MAAKLSKEVTTRMKSCMFVVSALHKQGPRVATLLSDIVRPHLLEDDEAPSFLAHIVAFARTLQAALERLLAIDRTLYDTYDRQTALRRVRGESFELLGKQISGLRQTVLGQYTAPQLESLGLQDPRARDTFALLRQAELIGHKSTRDDLARTLGDGFFSESYDPRSNAEQIQETSRTLRSALEQINTAQREIDELLVEKAQIMSEHDVVFLRVARQFEELCRFTGQDKLAEKVRATQPVRAQQEPGVDGEPSPVVDVEVNAGPDIEPVPGSISDLEPASDDAEPGTIETAPI